MVRRAKNYRFKGRRVPMGVDADGNNIMEFAETIMGVPARDLNEEDVARLDDELFDRVVNSGLYEEVPEKKTPEKKSSTRKRVTPKSDADKQKAQENTASLPENRTNDLDALPEVEVQNANNGAAEPVV